MQNFDRLNQHQVSKELETRGEKATGFWDDDATRLQKIYDDEFKASKLRREHEREQLAERRRKALLAQQQLERDTREMREERDALNSSPRIAFWIDLVERDKTPPAATLSGGVGSASARALGKALAFNTSLTALDLSRNPIGDVSGQRLAQALYSNRFIVKLELEETRVGVATAQEFGKSLRQNNVLSFLNLENNPLTEGGHNYDGVRDLAAMLPHNRALTSLNLWRTQLGPEGGKLLASKRGIQGNDTLISVGVGCNNVDVLALQHICAKVEANKAAARERNEALKKRRQAERKEAERKAKRDAEAQRKKEEDAWLVEQAQKRTEARAKAAEEERIRKLEEEARLAEERRLAEEARLAAEEEARRKRKKKKKKKKKK